MFKKIKPEDVFTPRGKSVNEDMYVHREVLEGALKRAIRKHKNIVIHGESGTGKTWLYKKVFNELGVHYEVLNSATITQCGSISESLKLLIARVAPKEKVGYDEKKSAEGNAGIAKASLEHTGKYSYRSSGSYFELIKLIRKNAGSKRAFLVIENLEHIVRSREMVKELSSLLLYLDDEAYAEHDVRILLVGTPNNLRDYFNEADETQTIINRLQEIPEVSALTKEKVFSLVEKGLFEILRNELICDSKSNFNKPYLLNAISWFSINIPQYVHDICLEIAMQAEENCGNIANDTYLQSLRCWVQEALISENTRLEKNINSKETRHGRRNQVIYTAGTLHSNEFSINEIEEALRIKFPISTKGKALNISSNLIELSRGTHPIFSKTPKGNRYRFIDPKIKIMIRWMMKKEEGEKIVVKKFDDGIKF